MVGWGGVNLKVIVWWMWAVGLLCWELFSEWNYYYERFFEKKLLDFLSNLKLRRDIARDAVDLIV